LRQPCFIDRANNIQRVVHQNPYSRAPLLFQFLVKKQACAQTWREQETKPITTSMEIRLYILAIPGMDKGKTMPKEPLTCILRAANVFLRNAWHQLAPLL
jgi:hypothetical protein